MKTNQTENKQIMSNIKYNRYVNELVNIIYRNGFEADGGVNLRTKEIGVELYRLGGNNALLVCMNKLTETCLSEFSNDYLGALYNLEMCWENLDKQQNKK